MQHFVFDFDSTLTRVEAFDELAEISLAHHPQKSEILQEISDITNQGIDGEISFTESLQRRIALLQAKREHLDELIARLKQKVSKSIQENKQFFEECSDQILVLSCGFKEFIDDIVVDYNIPPEKVFANTFRFDEQDNIIGFDEANPLASHNGKIQCLKNMNLAGEVHVIGDGYSDYVTKEAGIAHKFIAFTENVNREKATRHADMIAPNLDEFLYQNQLPRKNSYPKHRIKILLLENIHPDAFHTLTTEGFTVETVASSLNEEELVERIQDVHIIGIRSKTQITQAVLERAPKLLAVGAFCIGTKQIDLDACKRHGVVVFNAPYSNTRSVVELAIGQMIMLQRSIFARSTEMHSGQWNKTAAGAKEIRGKTLGIIGYGNIGKQVSILAEALGMKVLYYDIQDQLALGNAQKCHSLQELLSNSDIVSLHIDDSPSNHNFIGQKEIQQMKDGAILLNLARGFVVDISALELALRSGKLAGASVDVFPVEPKANGVFETPLQGIPNVILTPHIGGSTEEAQRDIADFVPSKLMAYVNSGNTVDAVNFPNIRLPKQEKSHRFLHIHKNTPGVMANITNILAKYQLNISGQYLSTDPTVGYVITDLDKQYNKEVIDELKQVNGTIKFRVLY